MTEVPAALAREALLQVTAAEVLEDRLEGERAEESAPILVAVGVGLLEALAVFLDEAVEDGLAGTARAVDSRGALGQAAGRAQYAGRSRRTQQSRSSSSGAGRPSKRGHARSRSAHPYHPVVVPSRQPSSLPCTLGSPAHPDDSPLSHSRFRPP